MFSAQASQVSDSKLYVDDVFSTYLYTGNGSTQTINNGIDLAGKGGLVWTKLRNLSNSHGLSDTARGVNKRLSSDLTDSEYAFSHVSTFNSTGFDLGNNAAGNASGYTYVSWTFRKAAKFFDCGTYVGDGNAGRQISHALGTSIGMVIVKATSAAGSWLVIHRGSNGTTDMKFGTLETTNALSTTGSDYSTYFNTSTFAPGIWSMNASGVSYVWYAVAHDTSADGIIQCGSFTTDGSGNATVTTGWETQFVVRKASSTTGNWDMVDTMRGMQANGDGAFLRANLSNAELWVTGAIAPTATGFVVTAASPSTTYIYLAIRRPNKPPTSGTQVYSAAVHSGNNAVGGASVSSGAVSAPDMAWCFERGVAYNVPRAIHTRLQGKRGLQANSTSSEFDTGIDNYGQFDLQNGFRLTGSTINMYNVSGVTYVTNFFKRAPGVFSICAYSGTGVASRQVSHDLGVPPDLLIVKSRSNAERWCVNFLQQNLVFNLNQSYAAFADDGAWFGNGSTTYVPPTSSVFTVSNSNYTNLSGGTFVAYLWATKAGISKVTSVTKSSGASLNVDCGFSTGARFVMLKRTDAAGDWYVWDSVRGIVSANDPFLLLNSTAAENTSTDYIDPYTAGFTIVDGGLANGTYLVLAYS